MSHAITSAERADILQRTREIVDSHIGPRSAHHDQTGEFPIEGLRALGKAGLMGLFVPREYGGLQADYQTFISVAEMIGQACPSTAMIYVMHHNQYIMVVEHGTEQQKAFFLPPIARGESLLASATTEAEVGGNADYCVSAKRREGDTLVLSARKPVVTAARHADWVFCTTRASPEERGNVLSMVAMPGLSRSQDVKPFGAWDCVGMRATESSGLEYTECAVPAWHQIGPEDSWPVRASSMTVVSRAGFSAVWLGIAQAAYAQTVAHVTRRTHQYIVDGKREEGQAPAPKVSVQNRVAEYETVQRQVAEMRTQVESARQLLLAAGRRIDELREELRGPRGMEALGDIQDLLWTARIACGEASIDVTRVGLRVCGVAGMRRGLLSLERNMRDALTSQVMAPSEDVTKLMLGRKLLGVAPPDRSRSGV